jgi:hypothetical protein
MNPYTVFYIDPNKGDLWQFYNCLARDGDQAEDQCIAALPSAEIIWVNEGHDNELMD